MTATIRDVARLAGVSVATVSRVINASAVVQPDTRQRVLDAARQLRFAPNSAARSLITQRTGAVGVILPDLYGEFFSELLRGMDQTAQRFGHHMLVSSSHHARSGLAAAIRAMRGRVDGLIVMASDLDPAFLADLLPTALPTVLVNSPAVCDAIDAKAPDTGPRADIRTVVVDNFGGAYAMTQHFLGLGHQRVAFVAGPADNAEAMERLRGYHAAMHAASLPDATRSDTTPRDTTQGDATRRLAVPLDDSLCVRGDFTEEGGQHGVLHLLSLAEPPSAIFAANDATAIGVLSALRDAGVSVPRDIAVAGFDDIPVAQFLTPPLTTVRVGIAALGERAMRLLLAPAAQRSPPALPPRSQRDVMNAEIVVRASCGAMARPPSPRRPTSPPPPAAPTFSRTTPRSTRVV